MCPRRAAGQANKSGHIDSLAVLQIVVYLEETYKINFRENGLDPGDLSSIGAILDLIKGPPP